MVMTMLCYKIDKSIMTVGHYKSGNNNDESDNNEDKVYLLHIR